MSLFKGFSTPERACPNCGYLFDKATRIVGGSERAPASGDITLCSKCGAVLRFTEGLDVIIVTPEEMAQLSTEFLIALLFMQRAIRETVHRNN